MSRTRAHRSLKRRGRAGTNAPPDDLYRYAEPPSSPRVGRPVKRDLADWIVTDDWPDHVPVTETELDLFEAHFGPLLEELLGSKT